MTEFANDDTPRCVLPYHDVGCVDHKCSTCGWNPEVSKQRCLKKFGEKYVTYITDKPKE